MHLDRRGFLKVSAVAATGVAFGGLGISMGQAEARAYELKTLNARTTTSICCYCSVGCGLIVHTAQSGPNKDRAVNIEGDPDHPINEGSLCAKGASLWQLVENDDRMTKVLYRAPNSEKFEEKTWDWALDKIARRVKDARDLTFEDKNAMGQVVNRTNGICHTGSAALDNEECWYLSSLMRCFGLVYIEHQARI